MKTITLKTTVVLEVKDEEYDGFLKKLKQDFPEQTTTKELGIEARNFVLYYGVNVNIKEMKDEIIT